jgi:hypothetical protein
MNTYSQKKAPKQVRHWQNLHENKLEESYICTFNIKN